MCETPAACIVFVKLTLYCLDIAVCQSIALLCPVQLAVTLWRRSDIAVAAPWLCWLDPEETQCMGAA